MSVATLRLTRAVIAREIAPDGGPVVVDLGAAIEPGVEVDERLEILAPREGREAVAIDADQFGRDALADLGLVPAVGQDHQTAVAVQVDEAGRDDLAGGVDRVRDTRWGRVTGLEDADPAVDDGDRPRSAGDPGAIDDGPARDEQVGVVGHPRRPGPASRLPPDPGAADHVGVRPEDEPRREVGRVFVDRLALEGRHERGIHDDQVGLLAGLERTDDVAEAERPRALQRPHPEPVEGVERRALVADQRTTSHLRVGSGPHDREDRGVGAARHIRPEPDREAGLEVARERHDAGPDEEVRGGAMGDPRPGLDEAGQLAIRAMDRVREDRVVPQPAGSVVDVDVIARVGEEPRDLRDLARILGDVGLPPGTRSNARGRPIRAASRPCTRWRTAA